MKALLCFIALLAAFWASADQPLLLIIQYKVDVTSHDDPNVALGNLMADQFEIEGRVRPMVWSLADKEFRAIVESGRIGDYNPSPSPEEVNDVAKKLHAEYIFVMTAKMDGGELDSGAQLYRQAIGKPIWSETKRLGVAGAHGVDWDSTARSITNTWAVLLSSGPFKKLKPQPRMKTPDPEKGQGGTTPAESVNPGSNADVLKRSQELIAAGQSAEAITLLRSAVDDKPFDVVRREALIRALLNKNLYQEAAGEARRAVMIAPDHANLRLLAARSWLRLGKLEEAQKDLNEALARNVQDPIVQLLLGELALERGEPEKGIEPYQAALDKQDSFEVRLGLGLCFGLTGNARGASASFNNLPKAPEDVVLEGYGRAVRLIDRSVDSLAATLRQLMQQAHVKPKDPALIEAGENSNKLAESLSALVGSLPTPKMHLLSQQRRDLAQKLLLQASEQVLEYLRNADEDAGGEALLSLSEAMKQIGTIRKQYEYEKVPGSAPNGS